ncbi:Glyoxylate/hydroxypyruvate reductase HPR3 [Linum grandiflorum]
MESPATQEDDPPQVLVLKKPPYFSVTGDNHLTSTKFRFLNAFDSTLPLHEFLIAHACTPVRALLSSGGAIVDAAVLDLLPELRVIVTTSAGLNQLDLLECRRRGIKIANAGDIYSADVADSAVGLLIDVLRKISASNRYVKSGLWPSQGDYPLATKLGGKRIGIVGLGRIGYQIAKRLEALGCSISYNSRKQKDYATYPFYEHVHELAANSLGKEGVIVNIARGAVVDEQEMVRCLVEGEIGGAGLDVFENEPEVPQVLMKLDNVVLSPHCAVFTRESLMDIAGLVVGNLEAFFANKPLLSEYQDD